MAVLYTDIPVRWTDGPNPDPPQPVEDGNAKSDEHHGSAHVHKSDRNNSANQKLVRVRVMSRDGKNLNPPLDMRDVKFSFKEFKKKTTGCSCPDSPFEEEIGLDKELGQTGHTWWPQGGSKSKPLTVKPSAFPPQNGCTHRSHEYEIHVYVMRKGTEDTWPTLSTVQKAKTLVDPHVRFHDDDG